jgi:hypothetical protein
MYSLLLAGGKEKSTAKGVKRSYANKYIRHADYYDCLVNEKPSRAKWWMIRARSHALNTVEVTKDTLSPYDDKRYLREGMTDTLAYGHYKISEFKKLAATASATGVAAADTAIRPMPLPR